MELKNGKAVVEESVSRLRITIPSKKTWFLLIFAVAWMGGWFGGLIMATGFFSVDMPVEARMFVVFWFIGWSVGGCFVILFLLWGFFGKETIVVENRMMQLHKTIFGLGRHIEMNLKDVKHIEMNTARSGDFMGRMAIYGFGPGKIKLDHGLKTFSFGLGLDDAEARYLVELLNKRIGSGSGGY